MKKLQIPILIYFTISFSACGKEWLEERSDKSLVVPTSLADLQALLDNTAYMNGNHLGGGTLPEMGENGADDYILDDNVWNSMSVEYKNAYIWNEDIFEGNTGLDWNRPYMTVFYSNIVMGHLSEIIPNENELLEYKNIKGSALFFRANAFFHLAQVFGKPYNHLTAETDLGIPLRLDSDFNTPTARSTIRETYEQIISDLEEALPLLPNLPQFKTRPSKAAVYGLKARIYLVMQEYENALLNAEACFNIQSDLIDFNSINVNSNLPFLRFNSEVIFDASIISSLAYDYIVSPYLYSSYGTDDLRKFAYFREVSGDLKFKGSYIRSQWVCFGGLATDEIYLIIAECSARLGQVQPAMETLNTLLENRYTKVNGISSYTPIEVASQEEAIDFILDERRRELPFRGLRWMDLRRLNLEGRNITLTRIVNGIEYVLEANSPKYTYPIPDDVILASGIEQNER